jgi:hypothetical protein
MSPASLAEKQLLYPAWTAVCNGNVHEHVKLGCLQHPAAIHLAWSGAKPDGHGSLGHRPGGCCTLQHKLCTAPSHAPLQVNCCFFAVWMLVLAAGLLLHATECLGPEPASKGAAVCSLVRCKFKAEHWSAYCRCQPIFHRPMVTSRVCVGSLVASPSANVLPVRCWCRCSWCCKRWRGMKPAGSENELSVLRSWPSIRTSATCSTSRSSVPRQL